MLTTRLNFTFRVSHLKNETHASLAACAFVTTQTILGAIIHNVGMSVSDLKTSDWDDSTPIKPFLCSNAWHSLSHPNDCSFALLHDMSEV